MVNTLKTPTRFSRDIVLADHQFPGEPDGRIIVMGSRCKTQTPDTFSNSMVRWVMTWLESRVRESLNTISHLSIDATFKVTPGNFQQLLVINARIAGDLFRIILGVFDHDITMIYRVFFSGPAPPP